MQEANEWDRTPESEVQKVIRPKKERKLKSLKKMKGEGKHRQRTKGKWAAPWTAYTGKGLDGLLTDLHKNGDLNANEINEFGDALHQFQQNEAAGVSTDVPNVINLKGDK